MNIPQFRQKFLSVLKTLNISYQRKLANTCEKYKQIKNDYDNTYDTALLHCCYIGDKALIDWCCNHGVDVNRYSYHECSPIWIACNHGHTEIVKMLLERRADCNKCDRWGNSPLIKACLRGYTEIVKMLLERKADCNKCDRWGNSPLILACINGDTVLVK
ncbi:protein fem-1 homolog C-like [Mytilus edulis]